MGLSDAGAPPAYETPPPGRDQMQALTGLFAKQFGTPNYAAHGGFCSVNMAAGMIYTMGGSFWEFGGPDLERAKLFVMIGTAEDHHSNPIKIALSKFKREGGRFVSVNPVRTGYSAIADEWVPVRPGTDGALLLAWIREIIHQGLYDRDFLIRYTNAAELVGLDPASPEEGLFVRGQAPVEPGCFDPQNKVWWDRVNNRPVITHAEGADPYLLGSFRLADGRPVKPAFQLLMERVEKYTPEWAEGVTGIPAATVRRLAHEMGVTARDQRIELPIPWTDCWDQDHGSVTGNPVAFHAMRGLAAHSNGFQTIRALAILMTLLGTIDRPGGFRHKPPFPRPVPPCAKPPRGPDDIRPGQPLNGMPLGWPASPEDLFLDEAGEPLRIDKGFSWEYPLAVHGLMHNVITNAWRGDPYRLDTLLIFMANMAWNSAMHTAELRRMLADRDEAGEYRIPFLVVCDAFQSEMTAFADLVLPDTTYLERHDVMSMLDRPISEFDGPVDAVRVPVVPPKGECKPFQDVLIELGTRLRLPAFVHPDGARKYRDYPDFIVNYETEPGSGIGFLSGWRGQGLFLALYTGQVYSLAKILPPQDSAGFYAVGSLIAVLFLIGGLIASFFHLGRPERGWRSIARWRTSWLSREVLVLPATMGLVALYGLAHWLGLTQPLFVIAGAYAVDLTLLLGALASVATFVLFVCTAMIYASLKFLEEWHSPLTVFNYILLGSASGYTLAAAFSAGTGVDLVGFYGVWAVTLTMAALATRGASLVRNARLRHQSTLQSAIGVRHTRIRQIAQGAMGGSFNTREFFHGKSPGFTRTMRATFLVLVFPVPVVLLGVAYGLSSPTLPLAAFALQYLGLLAERWYFFAEARHPQNLYYQSIA